VRVLNVFATTDAAPRDVVGLAGMPEDVRTALLEVLYKLDNAPAVV